MIRNDLLQVALIAHCKASSDITNEVPAEEIREDQWQGTTFSYPNIRVRLIDNTVLFDDCVTKFKASIIVFSEDYSSKSADYIAGIISSVFHSKSFSQSGLALSTRVTSLIPAYRMDVRTWQAEVLIQGIASLMV